jgi:hypothetical protein
LTLDAAATSASLVCGSTPPPVNESGTYAQLSPGPSHEIARHNTLSWSWWWTTGPSALVTGACFSQPTFCKSTALTLGYG